MPNTVITLKKSSTPSSVPANLANGEIAINYADGKLFYKNVAGQIVEFSPPVNAFGTINANGTLVISDTINDVVSLVPGTGIGIVGDALTDTITFYATGNAIAAFDASNVSNSIAIAAFVQANTARDHANASFVQANTARVHANAAHLTSNAAFVQANTARDNSNTARTVINDTVGVVRYLMFSNGTSGTTTLNVAVGLTFVPSSNTLNINGPLNAVTKSFVIPHPTKANKTLRYGSLEGPENGVYVRGRSKKKTIELPDYWEGLVDEDTITVQLTPIGKPQKLYVKSVSIDKVMVGGGRTVDFFYTIFGERKDVEKLVVEF